MTEQTDYYIKELDYTGSPKWAVYERTKGTVGTEGATAARISTGSNPMVEH